MRPISIPQRGVFCKENSGPLIAAMLHFDQTAGSTAVVNSKVGGLAFTSAGAWQISTTGPKFGTGWADNSGAGNIRSSTSISFTGPFCISMQIQRTGYIGKPICLGEESVAGGLVLELNINQVNVQKQGTGTTTNIIALTGGELGQPGDPTVHLVLNRDSSNLIRLVINGTVVGSVTDSTTFSGIMTFGDKIVGGVAEGGAGACMYDEVLVCTNDPIYSTYPFTAPTSAYTYT